MHPYLRINRTSSETAQSARNYPLQRRTDFDAHLGQICGQFSNATGWALTYEPAGARSVSGIEEQLREDTDCRWFSPIGTGSIIDGYLRLDTSESRTLHTDLSQARELAEVVRQLCVHVRGATQLLEARTESVMSLLDVVRQATVISTASSAIQHILESVVELTDFCTASFFMLSPDGNRLLMRAVHGIRLGEIPSTCRDLRECPPDLRALTSGSTVIRRADVAGPVDWLPQSASVGFCRSIESAAGPIGTLWAFDRRDRNPEPMERRVLESVATLAASLLERCALHQQTAEQGRLCRDVEIACDHQNRARSNEHKIEDSRVDIATFTHACDELSGDLLDLVAVDDDQVLLLVGDATGHSVPAAMIMSSVRGAMRALVRNGHVPADETDTLMQHVNRTWYEIAPSGSFMSLFVGLFDLADQTLTWSNAGHPKPFVFRGGQSTLLDGNGLLLGIEKECTYKRSTLALQPGDQFVAFTDGVTEALDSHQEMFRYHGIMGALTTSGHPSAEQTMSNILFRLERHTQGNYADDRTLAVLRFPHTDFDSAA